MLTSAYCPTPLQTVVAVVKHQLHRSLGAGRRVAAPLKITSCILAAKLLRRSLAQHPAHRVNHIRLAAAVRPDNRNKLPRHMNRGRVGKDLKPESLMWVRRMAMFRIGKEGVF